LPKLRRFLLVFAVLAAGLGTGEPVSAATHSHTTTSKPAAAKPASTSKPKPRPAVPAAPIEVTIPQLLVDMQTGDVLYEKDAGEPWHPASLTKLMTAYVTFEAIQQGRVSLDTKVTMSVKAVNEAPARSGLRAGDSLSLKDALYVMLVKSANDMAVAVAETVDGSTEAFAAEMNATAAKLGLTRTHYDNVNGLPDDGQVTTARDLAVLAIDLRRTFPQYDPIFRTHMVTLGKTNLRTNNELLTRFAGTTGMKTGYICASGLNVVATVSRGGRELLAVVLGGASARERDQMAASMLLKGFDNTYPDTGNSVVNIANDLTAPPKDMKPLLCGRQAKAYVTQRLKDYPLGLRGQPSYLTDKVTGAVYAAADYGAAGAPSVPATADEEQGAQGDAGAPGDATAAATPLAAIPLPQKRPASGQ
jgi:D-alanyl-D-alanine carboxypeptidase